MFNGKLLKLNYILSNSEEEINKWFIKLPEDVKKQLIKSYMKHLLQEVKEFHYCDFSKILYENVESIYKELDKLSRKIKKPVKKIKDTRRCSFNKISKGTFCN